MTSSGTTQGTPGRQTITCKPLANFHVHGHGLDVSKSKLVRHGSHCSCTCLPGPLGMRFWKMNECVYHHSLLPCIKCKPALLARPGLQSNFSMSLFVCAGTLSPSFCPTWPGMKARLRFCPSTALQLCSIRMSEIHTCSKQLALQLCSVKKLILDNQIWHSQLHNQADCNGAEDG